MGKNESMPEEDIEARQEAEQRKDLERVIRSEFFAGAEHRIKILRYLFDKRNMPVMAQTIALEALNARSDDVDGPARARQHIKSLRESLEKYVQVVVHLGQWRFVLPRVEGTESYQLRVVNLHEAQEPGLKFWQPHLEPSRRVTIIYDEPLFYLDESGEMVIRVLKAEKGAEKGGALKALKRVLKDDIAETLTPCHLYALSGEIGARDRIADWFAEETGIKTGREISRTMRGISEIADSSPILLGNIRTNKIIEAVTGLHQFSRFGYFVDTREFRTVEVRGCTEEERGALERYSPEVIGKDLVLHENPQSDKVVFGVVTRLPNPYDKEGAITILSAGYTRVLKELADTLTSGKHLLEMMDRAGLPGNRKFPRYFQGLFSIRLGPSGPDDKPARPKLRCSRHFDKFAE